jgi:CheY-like chemotaxis protein
MAEKKILVIDDDPDILDTIMMILKSNGYNVITCMSGEESVEIAEREKPDMILCDMMMESIDEGTKVAQKIRKKNKKVPIFLVSSIGAATSSNIDIAKLGFNGVFQKPVNPETLLSAVKKTLS